MDQAGQQRWAADDLRRRYLGVPGFHTGLHGVELCLVDDRWDRDRDDFLVGLVLAVLGAPVELVLPDIGPPGQHPVDGADAPTSAVAGEDTVFVQIFGDRLDAHRAGRAVTLEREPKRQTHGIGVERIDLQLLLGLRTTLLGRDHPVADRRQRAVPEALSRILLQGAKDVLGVLLGLILVEQRHDLAHHDVHRVVAHLLGDRHKANAVLRQFADVELQLEVIAEKATERVDDHYLERRGLRRPGLDHLLELGAAVVGGRCARVHEGLDKLIATRGAISFALVALVGDRHVMLGLPRRRDAQVKGSAQRHGHDDNLLTSSARPEQLVEQVAEPRLEHIDFGLGDGDALRPIVGDGPPLKVIFRRTARKRPRPPQQSFELLGCRWLMRTRQSGHCARVAELTRGKNSVSLRWDTLPGLACE
ncbi:MAG TPA: hypothetical protein VMU59_08655 [Caulobacteraceae bacterium]|nr:hypothetical protein [Caulobacteraceae bacterium]